MWMKRLTFGIAIRKCADDFAAASSPGFAIVKKFHTAQVLTERIQRNKPSARDSKTETLNRASSLTL